jgi:hypothetical protein
VTDDLLFCQRRAAHAKSEILILWVFAREAAGVVQGCTVYGAKDAKNAKKTPINHAENLRELRVFA